MKVYVFVDMEGISGISTSDFVVPKDGRRYELGCKYMTDDVNACVRGCFDGGASSVLVRDGHGGGVNLFWHDLDPRVELIQGYGCEERMLGLPDCDAVILLGYHARAGQRHGTLEHTYSSASVQNIWLNGRPAGEFAIDAALAADFGKPVIMTSGDDLLCAEARSWLPGVIACQTKQGLATQQARLLPRETAHRAIADHARQAVERGADVPLIEVERPVTLRVELIERGRMPNPTGRPDLRIVDGRTYETTADRVDEALARLF